MIWNLSIARKLWLAFGGILVVSAVATGWIFLQSQQLRSAVAKTAAEVDALGAVQHYRSALTSAHNRLLAVINTGDATHIAPIKTIVADLDDLASRATDGFAPADPLRRSLEAVRGAVASWRRDTLEPQLSAVADPVRFDAARLREGSVDNIELWANVEREFNAVADTVRARIADRRNDQAFLIRSLEIAALGAAAVLIAFCTLMAVVMQRDIAAPLRRLAVVTLRLKDRDFEVAIDDAARRDEVGELSRTLEVFRDQGRRAAEIEAAQARNAADKVRQSEALQRAISGFRDTSSGLLTELDHAGLQLGEAAASLDHVVGASYDFTRSVSSSAAMTGTSVESVAAAIEQMTASIHDISAQLNNVSRLTQTTSDATEVANAKVSGLQTRSDRIHEVVDLINGIAGQINLLALNATIEAARAGGAGKGFAVVAHEVKQLADQTAKATGDISRVIGQVSSDVVEVVDAIGVISTSIMEVNSNASAVAAAVEQQSAALNEISRNVNDVSQQTSGVAKNVHGVETKVGETRGVAASVNHLSQALQASSRTLSGTIDAFIGEVANDTDGSRATA